MFSFVWAFGVSLCSRDFWFIMEAVIEFHGFKDNYNTFIIKELAIVSKHIQCQLIFKSPFSKHLLNNKMARTCRWLTRHYHHIDWDEGDLPFNERLVHT